MKVKLCDGKEFSCKVLKTDERRPGMLRPLLAWPEIQLFRSWNAEAFEGGSREPLFPSPSGSDLYEIPLSMIQSIR